MGAYIGALLGNATDEFTAQQQRKIQNAQNAQRLAMQQSAAQGESALRQSQLQRLVQEMDATTKGQQLESSLIPQREAALQKAGVDPAQIPVLSRDPKSFADWLSHSQATAEDAAKQQAERTRQEGVATSAAATKKAERDNVLTTRRATMQAMYPQSSPAQIEGIINDDAAYLKYVAPDKPDATPSYQHVLDNHGHIIAINTKNPRDTVDTGRIGNLPASASSGAVPADLAAVQDALGRVQAIDPSKFGRIDRANVTSGPISWLKGNDAQQYANDAHQIANTYAQVRSKTGRMTAPAIQASMDAVIPTEKDTPDVLTNKHRTLLQYGDFIKQHIAGDPANQGQANGGTFNLAVPVPQSP